MASTAVSTLPKAVITTTGNAAFCCLIACRNSRPFIPGSFRSVTTRSTEFSRRSFSPASASLAESVAKPSSPRFNSSRRRILASSSTIRIVDILVGAYSPLATSAPEPQRNSSESNLRLRCLRGSRLVARGKKDYETSSLLIVTASFDANRSMMPVNNPRDNRQAESHTRFLGGHKRIEYLLP